MKSQSGFTLVEMIVVIAVISIISAIVTLNFQRMNAKYTVESNTKEIYSILMRARNDASTTNTRRLVALAANQVQTGVDTNGDGDFDGTPASTTYPRFTINFSASPVIFDRRGLTNSLQTISITGYSAGVTPTMDCIVIGATRINIGIMTGGNCDQR